MDFESSGSTPKEVTDDLNRQIQKDLDDGVMGYSDGDDVEITFDITDISAVGDKDVSTGR